MNREKNASEKITEGKGKIELYIVASLGQFQKFNSFQKFEK